jgi:hypothetical protein
MRSILFIAAVMLASAAYAQHFTKTTAEYDKLILARGVEATLYQSDDLTLEFTTFGVDKDEVIIQNINGSLRIKVSSKALWEQMEDNDWWVKVKIPYRRLSSIEVTTGATVYSKNILREHQLDLEASMGGEMDLQLDVKSLFLFATMGGIVDLTGTTEEFDVVTNMGAEIDASDLISQHVNAKANMGGTMKVNCSEDFSGKANMGGYIRVIGNPDIFRENSTMGGDISSRNN